MHCGCGQLWEWTAVNELDGREYWAEGNCRQCPNHFGVEGEAKEIAFLLKRTIWTDEAWHHIDRLPPYVAPLVQDEVEKYAQIQGTKLITLDLIIQSKNRGAINWNPEAQRRLLNVPAAVQAMAKIELERTAIDRGMPEVTVSLMEEVKARYFGMGNS